MSFEQLNNIIKNPKNSLRNQSKIYQKTHFDATLYGSFTVEASVILPMAIFAVVTVLSLFQLLKVQQAVQKALNNTALEASVFAQNIEKEQLHKISSIIFHNKLKKEKIPENFIHGGTSGISFQYTDMEGHNIDLVVTYTLRFPITYFFQKPIKIIQRSKMHKWIGWQNAKEVFDEVQWVYVTDYGVVFHDTKDCTHLKLTVRFVEGTEVNEIMRKYKPCEICIRNKTAHVLYVTDNERKYHDKITCRGLKRTIYMINIKDAQKYKPCTRCVN